jgi:hypothetical protein
MCTALIAPGKRLERRRVHCAHLIAIGNQHAVGFRQFSLAGTGRGAIGFAGFADEGLHGFAKSVQRRLTIEKIEMFLYSCIHAHILTPKLNCKHP